MKKNYLPKLIASLLAAGMLITSIPGDAYAYSDANAYEAAIDTPANEESLENTSENDESIDGNSGVDETEGGNDFSDNEVLQGEDEEKAETETSENAESEVSENASEDNSDNQNERILNEEELAAKADLSADVRGHRNGTEGVDYAANEILYLCDTQSQAEETARLYTERTGRNVTVKDFKFGVAVLELGEELAIKNAGVDCKAKTVSDYVELASDINNDLPPVYYNDYLELDSIEAVTDNEYFSDPNTKWKNGEDKNTNFQWFHEIIGTKYVWEAIDNGYLTTESSEYDTYIEALENTVVAVIDSGIYMDGLDFKTVNSRGEEVSVYVDGYDLTTDNPDIFVDDNGHGTHVAGIIADAANDYQGRGIAAGARLMILKSANAAGKTEIANTIKGINYARASRQKYYGINPGEGYDEVPAYNVQVINMSLGSYMINNIYISPINKAHEAGLVICSSAGNNGNRSMHYPSGYNHVICVGSVDTELNKSSFSCFGQDVDIAAPAGTSDYSPDYESFRYNERSGKYMIRQSVYASGNSAAKPVVGKMGTSMASPMASAAVALIRAKYPDMGPDEVEALIKSTAIPVNSTELGAGCINIAAALGLKDYIDAPKASVRNGSTIGDVSNIELTADSDNAVIYYTLNGQDPDIERMDETGTLKYGDNPEEPYIHIDRDIFGVEKSSVTIKTIAVLYSDVSKICEYTYYFDNDKVRDINIASVNGTDSVTVGKFLQLQAKVYPYDVANSGVIWESLNSSIATVSSKGLVSGLAEGEAVIRAKSADGRSTASCEFTVKVLPKTTNIEIELPAEDVEVYDHKTILLKVPENNLSSVQSTYDMSIVHEDSPGVVKGVVKVWPETALQEVTYKSSNSRIVKVDASGLVTAIGYGNATVTVTAADGSGVKDVQQFRVEVPVYKIDFSYPNGKYMTDFVISGNKISPEVTFNDGKSLPGDIKLKWSIESYKDRYGNSIAPASTASINSSTGVVSTKLGKDIEAPVTLNICAEATSNGIKAYKEVKVYKMTKSMNPTGINKIGIGSYYLDYFVKTEAVDGEGKEALGLVSVISDDPTYICPSSSIGKIDEIYLSGLRNGTSVITVKALDGSGKSVKVKITAESDSITAVGIYCDSGDNIFYPGKKLTYSFIGNNQTPLDDVSFRFYKMSGSSYTSVSYDFIACTKTSDGRAEIFAPQKGIMPTEDMVFFGCTGKKGIKSYSSVIGIEVYKRATSSVVVSGVKSLDTNADLQKVKDTYLLSKVGDKARISAYSLPEEACQDYYKYSTSDAGIVKVYTDGTIEAVKNGTATIYVTAGDGSKKKTSIKVRVNQEKITNLILSKTVMNLSTVAAGGVESSDEVFVENFLPATACGNVDVTTSNKKVATVTRKEKEKDSDSDIYVVKAVGKGTATIKFKATDGSKKEANVKVTVKEPVTSISLKSLTKSFILKPNKSLVLKATVNAASDKKIKYDFYAETAEERAEMERFVTLNKYTGKVTAKINSVDYDIEHLVKIYAKALDYGQCESNPVTIIVSPSKVLMKNLSLTSKSGLYDLSVGKSLTMLAVTSVDATNKKVVWKVENYKNGEVDDSDEAYATISSSGLLKAKGNVTKRCQVLVTATAVDGSEVSASRVINIYPNSSSLQIESVELVGEIGTVNAPNISNMNVGDVMTLDIKSLGIDGITEGDKAPCQKFLITYTAIAPKNYYYYENGMIKIVDKSSYDNTGKVYLNNSDGNSVTIKAFGKGTITVYATALDGSGKKTSYSITVK